MHVRVLYFAQIRQQLGQAEEPVTLPEGTTAQDLLDHLAARHQAVARMRPVLKLAVNERFVPLSQVLAEGDEVALIQPVAGGGPYCRVSAEPLVLQEVIDAVSHPDQGGIATFTGVVRRRNQGKEVLRLEYEAYTPMVLRTLGDIIQRLEAAWPGARVAIVHRTGVLQIGEAAVVIAASAPHRAESFAACQRAIDLLKEEVPIWKKEVSPQGEEWIGHRP